jgi:hypothetical protein
VTTKSLFWILKRVKTVKPLKIKQRYKKGESTFHASNILRSASSICGLKPATILYVPCLDMALTLLIAGKHFLLLCVTKARAASSTAGTCKSRVDYNLIRAINTCIAARWRCVGSNAAQAKVFVFSKTSRPALGPIQPPV